MDSLNKLRRAAQQFQQAGQQGIRENIEEPIIDPAREAIRKLAEAKVASEVGQQAPMGESLQMQRARQVNAPQVANPIAGGFTASQVQGLDDYSRLLQRQKEIAAQVDAEEAARAQSQAEFDPSQYQERPSRFQQLRQAVQSPRPVQPKVTVPQSMPQQGAILLSEDPEEAQRQIEAARRGQ